MDLQNSLDLLIIVNAGTFLTAIIGTVKLIRFMNRMEFKVDLLWDDYSERMNQLKQTIKDNA